MKCEASHSGTVFQWTGRLVWNGMQQCMETSLMKTSACSGPQTGVKAYLPTGQWPDAHSQDNKGVVLGQLCERSWVAQPKTRLEFNWTSLKESENGSEGVRVTAKRKWQNCPEIIVLSLWHHILNVLRLFTAKGGSANAVNQGCPTSRPWSTSSEQLPITAFLWLVQCGSRRFHTISVENASPVAMPFKQRR